MLRCAATQKKILLEPQRTSFPLPGCFCSYHLFGRPSAIFLYPNELVRPLKNFVGSNSGRPRSNSETFIAAQPVSGTTTQKQTTRNESAMQ